MESGPGSFADAGALLGCRGRAGRLGAQAEGRPRGGPARDLPERCCASPPEARHRFFCLQAIHSTVVPGLVPGTHWHWCKAMAYCIYILANRKHGTLYIGITTDVARRI